MSVWWRESIGTNSEIRRMLFTDDQPVQNRTLKIEVNPLLSRQLKSVFQRETSEQINFNQSKWSVEFEMVTTGKWKGSTGNTLVSITNRWEYSTERGGYRFTPGWSRYKSVSRARRGARLSSTRLELAPVVQRANERAPRSAPLPTQTAATSRWAQAHCSLGVGDLSCGFSWPVSVFLLHESVLPPPAFGHVTPQFDLCLRYLLLLLDTLRPARANETLFTLRRHNQLPFIHLTAKH